MKAKDLAQILLQNPEAEVEIHYEDLEMAEWEYVTITPEGIFISEYNPERIVLTEKCYVDEMKRLEREYVEIMTRPH
jgi:hypothetical protein